MLGSVDRVTNEYKKANDVFEQFIEDCCVIGSKAKVHCTKLWETFTCWKKRNKERYARLVEKKDLEHFLVAKGFKKDGHNVRIDKKVSSGWAGITLVEEDD